MKVGRKMIEKIKEAVNGKKIKIIGHSLPDFDSIASGLLLYELFEMFGIKSEFVIDSTPDEYTLKALQIINFDIASCSSVIDEDDILFLVDHHETKYRNSVVGCIDHHPTEKKYNYPIYINELSSSCALAVLRIMKKLGIQTTKRQAFIAVTSVYLDTKACKSSKFISSDKEWIDICIKKYGFDEKDLSRLGYCLTDMTKPIEFLALNDFKEYVFNDKLVCTSHIQTLEDDILPSKLSLVCDLLSAERARRQATLWILIVSEPQKEYTDVIKIEDTGVSKERYFSLLSRSIDIIPEIEREFLKKC